MVAGVVGMDLVMLVVAADEGIMPQTREHMDILGLLGIEKSILVINKCDLVDEEWLELVEEEIKEEENKIIERDGAWLVDGLLNVDEFKEFFHIDQELPGEEDDLYKNYGRSLKRPLRSYPKGTRQAKWNGYTFEVIDMDHTRIDKILVTYEEPIVEQEEEK